MPDATSRYPLVGSLCSGTGGLDMGLALVYPDLRVAWHVEYDPQPSKILAHHWPDVPNYGDVKHTDWADVEPVEILTAGYPCQPFSSAGHRKGADDPRHLWPGVARAISVLRPRLCLLENVRGHVSLGLDAVLGDLAELGYDATWGVVRASDAGAPHRRERIFVVASDAECEREPGRGGLRHLGGASADRTGEGLQRERDRDAAHDRSATPADANHLGHEWDRSARDGRTGSADSGEPAADTHEPRLEGHRSALGVAPQESADHGPAADTEGGSRWAGQQQYEAEWEQGDGEPRWGAYAPAIARWEAVTGRAAPRPTEPGRTGERLSPRFVEWMMGLPEGHVTDVPGLSRVAKLKALGNGVVPQQAALAVRALTGLRVAA